jgi:hypothetical protein
LINPVASADNDDELPVQEIIDHLLDHPAIPPEALRALHAKRPPGEP